MKIQESLDTSKHLKYTRRKKLHGRSISIILDVAGLLYHPRSYDYETAGIRNGET